MSRVSKTGSGYNPGTLTCTRKKECGKCRKCKARKRDSLVRSHSIGYLHAFGQVKPILVTLTYPAGPDLSPSEWMQRHKRCWKELKRRWGECVEVPPHLWGLQWTVQARPHLHIVMPSTGLRLAELREWLLQTWASVIGIPFDLADGHGHLVDVRLKVTAEEAIDYVLRDVGKLADEVGPGGVRYRLWDSSSDWPQCRIARLRTFIGDDGKYFDKVEYNQAKGTAYYWATQWSEAKRQQCDGEALASIEQRFMEARDAFDQLRRLRPAPNSWQRTGDADDEFVAMIDGQIVWLYDADNERCDAPRQPDVTSGDLMMELIDMVSDEIARCERISDPVMARLQFNPLRQFARMVMQQISNVDDPVQKAGCDELMSAVIKEGKRVADGIPFVCRMCGITWWPREYPAYEICSECDMVEAQAAWWKRKGPSNASGR